MTDYSIKQKNRTCYIHGLRNGIPIALGYFAVAFTLGIVARNSGLNAFQATLASLTNHASAGEYAGFTLIAASAGYLEMAIMILITNARYLLMSCALSQKFSPDTRLIHRLICGYFVTDEIFGISINYSYRSYLNPYYIYGAVTVASPGWALGTCLGVLLGNVLPANVVSALSVGLYGMFLAIIIPPARKNKVIAGLVLFSMAASLACTKISLLSGLSSGTRIILLTVIISLTAAILFPVKEPAEGKERSANA